MKRLTALLPLLAVLAACSSNPEEPSREALIDTIEKIERADQTLEVTANSERAQKMIELYDRFASAYPDDSLAPLYMMRSAEIMINMGNFDDGISMLDSVIALYPGFDEAGGCLFLKGQAYEQNQQYDLAREAYTEFITNYPDHVLAADTRKMLPLIGMSPEDQLAAILAQNAGK